jgi:hypothetical protein
VVVVTNNEVGATLPTFNIQSWKNTVILLRLENATTWRPCENLHRNMKHGMTMYNKHSHKLGSTYEIFLDVNMRVYSKVSGLVVWSENCKWYSSLPLGADVSLFYESV